MADAALPETSKPFISPGTQLAAYRQERGWTVEQVASQLNLAPRQIAAIESDDYSSLPGMPIVRGFMRSYAKLLKVDAAPLLTMLGGETAAAPAPITPSKTLAAPFAETRLPSTMNRSGLLSKRSGGLLLIILLGIAIWAAQQDGDLADFHKSATAQVKEGWASLSGSEQAQRKPDPAPSLANTDSASIPAAVSSGKPDTQSLASPAAPVTAAPVAKEPAPTVPALSGANAVTAGKDTLVLKAREDSWIEVRRASNDRSLLLRLMRSGESESVEITEPVSLVVGNAAGVDASLRGEPLEFKAGGSNVARLNLK